MFNTASNATSNKSKPTSTQTVHTLLGKDTLWKGEIHAGPQALRIEGRVEGSIHSEGEVTVAPTGFVKGSIHAKHLIVTGRIEGTFKVVECLEIHGTGWVEGEVEVGALVVDEGGTLQGTCRRRTNSKERPEKAPSNETGSTPKDDKNPSTSNNRPADQGRNKA